MEQQRINAPFHPGRFNCTNIN